MGLTLYELLTLRSGFSSSDRLKLIEQIENGEPERRGLLTHESRRSRDDRLESDRERPESAVPVGRGDERRPEAVPGRRARYGPDRSATPEQLLGGGRRRNPAVAALGGVLAGVLVLATVSSLLAARYFNQAAGRERTARQAESSQRERAKWKGKRTTSRWRT